MDTYTRTEAATPINLTITNALEISEMMNQVKGMYQGGQIPFSAVVDQQILSSIFMDGTRGRMPISKAEMASLTTGIVLHGYGSSPANPTSPVVLSSEFFEIFGLS